MNDDTILTRFDIDVVNELPAIYDPRGVRPVLDEREWCMVLTGINASSLMSVSIGLIMCCR